MSSQISFKGAQAIIGGIATAATAAGVASGSGVTVGSVLATLGGIAGTIASAPVLPVVAAGAAVGVGVSYAIKKLNEKKE